MGRPEFHRLADRELNEAAQYYELENPGLGSSFLKEVDRSLQSIEEHPEAGVILHGSVRRRLLADFPTRFCTRSSQTTSGFWRS